MSRSEFRFVCPIVLLFMLASVYCDAQTTDQTAPHLTYRFAGPGAETSLPFELNANKVYLPLRINKAGPYWFLLDTGSVSNAVDTEAAKSLNIKLGNSFDASGGGEKSVSAAKGSNAIFSVGDLELQQSEVDVEPISAAISAAEGRRVDGLLGYDFLSRFIVEIDYANRKVVVRDPKDFRYAGPSDVIPIESTRGNIFISTSLTLPDGKRVPGTFMVDTGWRSALSLTSPFVAEQKLMTAAPKTADAVTGMGIGGPTIDTIARMPSLKLGHYSVENFVANFSHAKGGVLSQSDFAGIIGAEILRRFKVTLDYPHHRMMLEPNAAFTSPYEFDMSGLFLTADGADFKIFKVYNVIKDSPGAQAGIREGDVIEAIDDRPASNFTLEQIRQMFKEAEGKEHMLTVKRDGKSFPVHLQLRRVI